MHHNIVGRITEKNANQFKYIKEKVVWHSDNMGQQFSYNRM